MMLRILNGHEHVVTGPLQCLKLIPGSLFCFFSFLNPDQLLFCSIPFLSSNGEVCPYWRQLLNLKNYQELFSSYFCYDFKNNWLLTLSWTLSWVHWSAQKWAGQFASRKVKLYHRDINSTFPSQILLHWGAHSICCTWDFLLKKIMLLSNLHFIRTQLTKKLSTKYFGFEHIYIYYVYIHV